MIVIHFYIYCTKSKLNIAIEARDLKGKKKIAPFCKVFQDKEKKFESEVMGKTHDPAWDEKARLM